MLLVPVRAGVTQQFLGFFFSFPFKHAGASSGRISLEREKERERERRGDKKKKERRRRQRLVPENWPMRNEGASVWPASRIILFPSNVALFHQGLYPPKNDLKSLLDVSPDARTAHAHMEPGGNMGIQVKRTAEKESL